MAATLPQRAGCTCLSHHQPALPANVLPHRARAGHRSVGVEHPWQPVAHVRGAWVVAAAGKAGKAPAAKGFGSNKNKKVDASMDASLPCPCGSGQSYEACCQPFINKEAKVQTAEQLLRSRYTAYALKKAEYIADTTSESCEEWTGSRTSYLASVRQTQKQANWLSLTIEKQEPGATPNEALIQFRASYVLTNDKSGRRQERQERSRFVKDARSGQWYYHGSEMLDDPGAAQAEQPKFPTFGSLPTINLPQLRL